MASVSVTIHWVIIRNRCIAAIIVITCKVITTNHFDRWITVGSITTEILMLIVDTCVDDSDTYTFTRTNGIPKVLATDPRYALCVVKFMPGHG